MSADSVDLHELSNSYKIHHQDTATDLRTFRVEFCAESLLLAKHSKKSTIDVSSVESEVSEKGIFTFCVPETYPNESPTEKFGFLAHLFTMKQQDGSELVDVDSILPGWTANDTLIDLANILTVLVEFHLQEDSNLVIRDFAYPLHTPAHWSRYTIPHSSSLSKARAIFEFEPKDENELGVSVGDILEVLYERDDGWLVGLMNGLSGLVPKNHVVMLDKNSL